jgi:putative flippase GtrA
MKSWLPTIAGWRQLIRYAVIGLLNNLLGYLVYLLITWMGLDPKVTISILYPIGIVIGFLGHSKYSFSYDGNKKNSLLRYLLAYAFGYLVNFMMLFILSDKLGFPHQAVQALAIFVVAAILFFLLKFFVFPRTESDKASSP